MNILFTGGSSFTGYWFIRELAAAGHRVIATFTQSSTDDYEGVRRRRVERLADMCTPAFDCRFGNEKFIALIEKEDEWGLLCHHAAELKNYKSPNFDVHEALNNNTNNLPGVLTTLKEKGCERVILTGSVFENDEGIGSRELRAFSPYGLSKGLTYQSFRYYCSRAGLRLGKFVIPNPFGPYEEKRFTHYLINMWAQNKIATVNTPAYIRDNIHVSLLSKAYCLFTQEVTMSNRRLLKLNPSGYVESQGEFTRRFAREMRRRLGRACELELKEQTDFSEPRVRFNTEPASELVRNWSEVKAWDELASYYRENYPL